MAEQADTTETESTKNSRRDIERGEDNNGKPLRRDSSAVDLSVSPYVIQIITQFLSIVGLAILSVYALHEHAAVRGFFCNDTGIALPYKEGSISLARLLCISVLFPAVFIVAVEGLLTAVRMSQQRDEKEDKGTRLGSWGVPEGLVQLYRYLGALAFALIACWTVTEVLKAAVGSLRPHFLDVCQPDWQKITCKPNGEYVYISDYKCTGDELRVGEGRRSFPSGHSSISMCGLLYTMLYLQSRFKWQQKRTAPKRQQQQERRQWRKAIVDEFYWMLEAATPCLQVLILALALYIPATRVLEHFHHVRDVLAGMTIGAVSALFASFFVIDMRA